MKHIYLFLLFLLPAALYAENVPESKAREVATNFLLSQHPSRSGYVSLQLVYDGRPLNSRIDQGDECPFYIYNNVSGQGFVIVSGDDLVQPILGFATDRRFVAEDMPDNLLHWLNAMKEEVDWAREYNTSRSNSQARAWATTAADQIKPVLNYTTAEWNQWWPYNKYTPTIGGKKSPTGCVMTAAAILMKYHGWPEKGVGTVPGYSYETRETKEQITLPERVLGEPYDWDIMPLQYDETASAEAEDQIGRLMMDLGTMMEAGYGPSSTGATSTLIPKQLAKYMNYDKNGTELYEKYYSQSAWMEKLRKELHANGPMVYGGANGFSGHAFILDGYAENNYFHFNWGWGGSSNGYFLLHSADIDDEDLSLFPLGQDACFGVIPTTKINNHPLDELFVKEFTTKSKKIELGKPFYVDVELERRGEYLGSNFYLSIWLTDADGNPKEQLSDDHLVQAGLDPDEWTYPYNSLYNIFCMCTQGFSSGDHIRIFYKNKDDKEWKPANAGEDIVSEMTIINAEGKLLTIEGPITFDFNRLSGIGTICYPTGTTIRVFRGVDGDVTSGCTITETKCEFKVPNQTDQSYSIILRQGKIEKLFMLNFSKNK